jgi:hypothetical protein
LKGSLKVQVGFVKRVVGVGVIESLKSFESKVGNGIGLASRKNDGNDVTIER